MAKAKGKAAKPARKKKTMRADPKAKTAEEIQRVRNVVTNLILRKSPEMAARVLQSVTDSGQVAPLKYLWEMSGLFPFEAGEHGERDSLARILLTRMGLEGKGPVIAADNDRDVESGEGPPD